MDGTETATETRVNPNHILRSLNVELRLQFYSLRSYSFEMLDVIFSFQMNEL